GGSPSGPERSTPCTQVCGGGQGGSLGKTGIGRALPFSPSKAPPLVAKYWPTSSSGAIGCAVVLGASAGLGAGALGAAAGAAGSSRPATGSRNRGMAVPPGRGGSSVVRRADDNPPPGTGTTPAGDPPPL